MGFAARSAILSFAASFVFATTAFMAPAYAGSSIPHDSKVLEEIIPHSRDLLSDKFSLIVWNVHKGSQQNKWAQDLKRISSGSELIMLQEAMKDHYMPSVLRSITGFGWIFATSWIKTPEMEETGVATGSPARPIVSAFRRSPGREPFTSTPKMSLVNTYRLESGVNLMTVNIHGINFVSVKNYKTQIDDLVPVIQKHKGPVIFAGDFNTWNDGRTQVVMNATKKLGLKQVHFPGDNRATKFDHIFIRGCVFSQGTLRTDIKSSDHPPLTVVVDCAYYKTLVELGAAP